MMDHIIARGHVDAFLVSPDGAVREVVCGHNTLSYACADVVARLFAGLVDQKPSTVAFVYAGDATKATSFHPLTDADRGKTQAQIVGTGLNVHEVAISPNPSFTSSNASRYSGNTVTFRATTTDNSVRTYIYGVILKDATGKVLATKQLIKDGTASDPIERPAGYALAVSWGVTFT